MFESSQEKIVAITSLFSLFIAIIYYSVHTNVFATVYMAAISLISIVITLINLGCVLNGGCTVWSWFLTLMIGVMAVTSIFIYGRMLMLGREQETATAATIPIKVVY
jgi:hypothetical protein